MKRLVSWNVNGIRAIMGKGFMDVFRKFDADFFCLQETKVSQGQVELPLENYHQFWNYADKKGYSGTSIFCKEEPLKVTMGIGIAEHDMEGRVISAEFKDWMLVNVYTPNSKEDLLRLDYRMKWEDDFRNYLVMLDSKKPVIVCGDLNVAHKEIDLKHPKTNRRSPGFTDEERDKLSMFLEGGFKDSFRHFYPDLTDAYTWWSYRTKAREKNAGWRIDYFCVSDRLSTELQDAAIHADIMGSDHCPVELLLK